MSTDRKPTKEEAERARKVLDKCLALKENKMCADCDERGPRWASVSLGVFMCLQCSGIHRKLGVHISKVKSVTLDSWTMDQARNMQRWGNKRVNAVYQGNMASGFKRPTPESSTAIKENFIRAKYERREFYGEAEANEVEEEAPAAAVRAPTIAREEPRPNFKRAMEKKPAPRPSPPPAAAAAAPAVDLLSFGDATVEKKDSGDLTAELFGSQPAPAPAPAPTAFQQNGASSGDFFQSGPEPAQPAQPAQPKKNTLTSENLMALYSQGNQPSGGQPIPFQGGGMGGGQRPISNSFGQQQPMMGGGGFGQQQMGMGGGFGQQQPMMGGGFGQQQMGGNGGGFGGGFGQQQPMMGGSGFGQQQPMMGGGGFGQQQQMMGGGFGQQQPMMGGGFGGGMQQQQPMMMGGGFGGQQQPMMGNGMGGGHSMYGGNAGGQRPISKPAAKKADPNDPFAGLTGL
eukprot:CAMPEP_0113872086 /NCGR_PEP_ID=MMETSP0780_2-20120614/3005_1 /TAXON_ID=652834 /ORGANISM="Palpitomonas bilix" /LENGTH=455 /DNA_ID=CAMNT_0000857553 /DNA_START=68 /DNA_END=1435 /DNA_ORIENTATION=- /assembly_acc=CAM_ASM_000599